jgi:hypothetical protein
MILKRDQIAIAHRLLEAERQPVQSFVCAWAAFEVIYITLAAGAGLRPTFALRRNGTMETRKEGKIKIAKTDVPSTREQIDVAFQHFGDELKHRLIVHPSTGFFVSRKPTWQGETVEMDGFGQRLNGVIDVSRTVDARYPVWSPISTRLYGHYVRRGGDEKTRDLLARQVIEVLCTVRHNLTQGGDRENQESGPDVLSKAVSLLDVVVRELVKGE